MDVRANNAWHRDRGPWSSEAADSKQVTARGNRAVSGQRTIDFARILCFAHQRTLNSLACDAYSPGTPMFNYICGPLAQWQSKRLLIARFSVRVRGAHSSSNLPRFVLSWPNQSKELRAKPRNSARAKQRTPPYHVPNSANSAERNPRSSSPGRRDWA